MNDASARSSRAGRRGSSASVALGRPAIAWSSRFIRLATRLAKSTSKRLRSKERLHVMAGSSEAFRVRAKSVRSCRAIFRLVKAPRSFRRVWPSVSSMTTMVSKSLIPRGTSEHAADSKSGVCSNARTASCPSSRSRSSPSRSRSPGTRARTGTVLISSPMILSAPGTEECRQARTSPNTTSSSPENALMTIAQAAWTKVDRRRPCASHRPRREAEVDGLTRNRSVSGPVSEPAGGAAPCTPSSVDGLTNPVSLARQNPRAISIRDDRSCCSQAI